MIAVAARICITKESIIQFDTTVSGMLVDMWSSDADGTKVCGLANSEVGDSSIHLNSLMRK